MTAKRSKKGAAMELAVMLLVITFALSSLVMTVSLLMHQKGNYALVDGQRHIVMEQIGRQFLDKPDRADWEEHFDPQKYQITPNGLTLTVRDGAGNTLLTVELKEVDGTYTVMKWQEY